MCLAWSLLKEFYLQLIILQEGLIITFDMSYVGVEEEQQLSTRTVTLKPLPY